MALTMQQDMHLQTLQYPAVPVESPPPFPRCTVPLSDCHFTSILSDR